MPGQAIVRIRDKQWQVALATTPWEQAGGLGGVPSIPPGAGMLFDLGCDQIITVTTMPMLFSLDIALISDSLTVVDIGRNVPPGLVISSSVPTRFFLEVNAGELEGIDTGDGVSLEFLPIVPTPLESTDWTYAMFSFMGFAVMGIFIAAIARTFIKAALGEPEKKPTLYGPRGEKLLPQTSPVLRQKWYEKGVEAGKKDGWMAVEDTLPETLSDHHDVIKSSEDLVWTDIDLWEETEHFWIFYGSKMWNDAKEDIDVYLDLKDEFWEGYLTGRKAMGIDIYQKASQLLKAPKLMPQTRHQRESSHSVIHLPFAGASKGKLWWLATVDSKTTTAEVTGIRKLSQRELEDAFANSWAVVSPDTATTSLPFAGVSKGRIWWLATINARTIEVKVSGIKGLSEIQLEDAFADSTATIYNSKGLKPRVIPVAMKEREIKNLRRAMRDWVKQYGEAPWSTDAKETFKLLKGRARAIGLSNEEFEKLWAAETEYAEPDFLRKQTPTRDDVSVNSFVERDRLGIWITDNRTDKVIAEWWDDDAREMFEDGFFKPGVPQHSWEKPGREFVDSVLDYAENMGLLAKEGSKAKGEKNLYSRVIPTKGEESGPSVADKIRQLGFDPDELWDLCKKVDEAMLGKGGVMWLSADKRRRGLEEKVYPLLREFKQKYGFDCPIGEGGVDVFRLERQIDNALRQRKSHPAGSSPAVIHKESKNLHPRVISVKGKGKGTPSELEYFADSPEFLTQTIDAIGYRSKLEKTFQEAIARAKGLKEL